MRRCGHPANLYSLLSSYSSSPDRPSTWSNNRWEEVTNPTRPQLRTSRTTPSLIKFALNGSLRLVLISQSLMEWALVTTQTPIKIKEETTTETTKELLTSLVSSLPSFSLDPLTFSRSNHSGEWNASNVHTSLPNCITSL